MYIPYITTRCFKDIKVIHYKRSRTRDKTSTDQKRVKCRWLKKQKSCCLNSAVKTFLNNSLNIPHSFVCFLFILLKGFSGFFFFLIFSSLTASESHESNQVACSLEKKYMYYGHKNGHASTGI